MSKSSFDAARKAMHDSFGPARQKRQKNLNVNYYNDGSRDRYPSLQSTAPAVCGRNSMMERSVLDQESEEVRAEILAKASRIVPLYNKGAVHYNGELD